MTTSWTREEKFGFGVAFGVHALLFLLILFITVDDNDPQRTAFIEVEVGAFQSGSPAEQSATQNEKVETSQQVSEQEPEQIKPDPQVAEKTQQESTDEKAKPVDTPDQTEPVESEDVVETPETEEISPVPSDEQQEEEQAQPPKAKQEEQDQEGEEETGDVEGLTGDPNADQGTSTDQDKSAPYSLKWDGEIERNPVMKPLPEYSEAVEAVITVRFQVRPDGSIGRIIPLKKMNPELEQQILSTLRKWQFSELPENVPQKAQWGTITFRFILD